VHNIPVWESLRPDDAFPVMLRRQGWHLIECSPVYTDPRVIQWRGTFTREAQDSGYATFYAAFGDNTVRKVVRAILNKSRTMADLKAICGDEAKLQGLLAYLEAGGVAIRDSAGWAKGPSCRDIDNTGTTLEWYVAEWFRHELQVPARHGVKLEEVHGGGDLDVVAFINDIRVLVECKTGKPDALSETDIRWFLQRALEFAPEIAVLLMDTESPITRPVQLVAEVIAEMNWLEAHPDATESPAEVRTGIVPTPEVPGFPGLFCCARNVFLTGVTDSIDASLSAVLRCYYSYLRHQLILPLPPDWNFVERRVARRDGSPFGVEGQVRFNLPGQHAGAAE
jgi:hypothetical protein